MKTEINYKKYIGKFLLLMLISAIVWMPLIVTLFTSFKTRAEIITQNPRLLPQSLNLYNYRRLFNIMDFKVYLKNSFLVASLTSVISLLVSSLAAFALTWMRFKGKKYFMGLTMFVYIFPQILLVMPLFLMCYQLNLLDTRFGIIITYLSFILPFGIWMLKNYFESIPKDLVDASLIDGCSYFQSLMHVVLPICLPAMATILTYSFVLGWNEFMFANILIKSNSIRTVAIGVQTLVGNHGTDFGLLTAAAVVMIIPVIIFFILIQRLFIDFLTTGSVKE